MKLPEFYQAVPALRVHDPLAELLGSAEGGVLEYRYCFPSGCPNAAACASVTAMTRAHR